MSHDQYIPSATLSDILMLNESELMNGEEDGSMVPMSPGRSRSNDTGETLSFLKHFNTPETWRLMSFDEKDFDKKTGDFNPRDLPGFFLDDDKEERTKKQKKSSNAKKEKTEKTTKKNKKDNFFGVSTTSRTTRDGKVSYFKIKVKHKGTEYYLGIRKDKFESVMVADAGYILVGELQKSNLERARKYVARDPSIQGSFDKYVQRLSDAMVSVLKDKIIEINTKPISDERKEKTQTLWKDGIRAKWGATPSSSSVRIDSYRERFKGKNVECLFDVFVNIDRNLGIHLDSDEVLDFLYYMIGQTQSLAPFCTATTTSATTSVPSTSVLTAGEQGDASSTTTAEDEEDPVKEAIEKLKLERSSELEKLRLENSRLKRQQQMSFQRVPRASMSSLMLSSVRNRCHELFNNEGHDPRMCFDCKHCDHAAWPVDIHEDGDDRSNGRKRKRTVKSAHPTQDAVIRNRIYYHGRKEDYSKLEYPFCAMDESSILETQDLFQCIANDFNQRYRGAASKPGEEHLLVLQLIELQKTINDVYMILNEGERVMTDGVLGRCTIRHLSAVGRLVEKHRNFVNNKNIPGLERVISAARILNKCETKYAASSGPTSRVVEEVGQDDDDDI